MNASNIDLIRDTLSRVAKVDLDNGTAPDVETAIARLHQHRVGIVAGLEVQTSAAHQAALLTIANIARRFALGGVTVAGDLNAPLLVSDGNTRSLADEIVSLGGRLGPLPDDAPVVVVGLASSYPSRSIAVTFAGWRGGVVPAGAPRLSEQTSVIPAAVLAGALACSEVFAMLCGEVEAGFRQIGLSLWRPDRMADWLSEASDGPQLAALPENLWVLGLGHLGQAFLWTLLMCPFADRSAVRLILQDIDAVTGSTDSTSILTQPGMVGLPKTRAVAAVLDRYDELWRKLGDDGVKQAA